MTIEELIDGLTGDIIFALNGVEITKIENLEEEGLEGLDDKRDSGTKYGEEEEFNFDDYDYKPFITALFDLKNETIFRKMIPMFNELGLNKDKSFYVGEVESIPVFTGLINNVFIISSYGDLKKISKTGYGAKGLSKASYAEFLKDAAFFLYINLNTDNFSPEVKSFLSALYDPDEIKLLKRFDFVSLTAYNDFSLAYSMTFKNKKDNGLKQIIQLIEDGAKKFI